MKFIPLNKINFETAQTQFKYKRSFKTILAATGLMSLSFIIPDASIGIVLGFMMLSPVKIKYQIRNKKEDLKLFINKKLIMWGWK